VNAPPVVVITSPVDGSEANLSDPVDLIGTATDPEEGSLATTLRWISDLDGLIAIGSSVTHSGLSAGTHLIRAEATDGGGLEGYAEVTLHVNAPPTIAITTPANLAEFRQLDEVPLVATAMDPEDGDLGASVVWTSNLEGEIASGDDTSFQPMTLGPHAITAAVADSDGVMVTEQRIIVVPEPGVLGGLGAGLALLMVLTRSRRRG
jgi:hypothetical protein